MSVALGVVQMAITDVLDDNVAKAIALVRDAASQGATVVLLPELFEGYYWPQAQREHFFERAHPVDGHPFIPRFQALARELGVVLPLSFFEKAGHAHYNSLVMIDATGELLGLYRKSHIPADGFKLVPMDSLAAARAADRDEEKLPAIAEKTPTVIIDVPAHDADAETLAELYRKRWTIETVFQEITTTLRCEIQTLGYPKAALFAFCLALVAFNAVSLLKASLRAVHGTATVNDTVSGYYLNLEIRGTYEGMMIAIPEKHWKSFRTLSVQELAKTLKEIAGHVTLSRYRKHPRGPKKPPPKKTAYANGGHVSTFRLLNRNE